MKVRLGSSLGREVSLQRFHLLPTETYWSGQKTREERLHEIAKSLGFEGWPLLIKPANSNIPPAWTCIASFHSELMEKQSTPGGSYLVICWFTQMTDTSIRQLICEALAGVDWDSQAKDSVLEW